VDLVTGRLVSQGLARPSGNGLAVVRRLVGLQAQDEWVAPYAIRTRAKTGHLGAVAVSWLMRGTLHMVAADDLRWLVDLLGPYFVRRGRARRRQLGLTDELIAAAVPELVDRLPATRAELLDVAAAVGVPAGQARAHLLAYAGMTGELCLIDGVYRRVPAGRKVPDDRAAELARRYLTGHAPASVEDFAVWSGLPMSVARPAFPAQHSPEENRVEEGPVPRVKLLGHFDPYLLGYKDRGFALDPAYATRVQRGGGFVLPVVLVDGRVAGTWARTWSGDIMRVTVDAWAKVPPDELAAEIEDLNRPWWR
jgi:hypothetical protein